MLAFSSFFAAVYVTPAPEPLPTTDEGVPLVPVPTDGNGIPMVALPGSTDENEDMINENGEPYPWPTEASGEYISGVSFKRVRWGVTQCAGHCSMNCRKKLMVLNAFSCFLRMKSR